MTTAIRRGFYRWASTLFAAALALTGAGQVAAMTLSLQPSQWEVYSGETTRLTLQAQGFPIGIGAYDISIRYDPALLQFVEEQSTFPARTPSQLACPGRLADCTDWGSLYELQHSPGSIRILEVSLAPADDLLDQFPNLVIAALAFRGTTMGISPITIVPGELALGDRFGEAILPTAIELRNATLEVPSPSTLSLAAGVISLMLMPASRSRSRR